MNEKYTQTRITKEYLEKLRKIADTHKRSMLKQLEVMIDEEMAKTLSSTPNR